MNISNFIFIAEEANFFTQAIRGLFAHIDKWIYDIIELVVNTIFQLSEFRLDAMAEAITSRVYVIVGIFMLFKVIISMITYMANPDKINDKEKGASKLAIRVVVVLLLLILIPNYIIGTNGILNRIQGPLLSTIPRILIGSEQAEAISTEERAAQLSNVSLNSFLQANPACGEDVGDITRESLKEADVECGGDGREFKYEYKWLLSTVVGVILVVLLCGMCIDVGIRSLKLIILKALAPIPIISYVDPKSAKDGMFSAWVKTFISTWVDLFIKIGVIYFVLFLLSELTNGGLFGNPLLGAQSELNWFGKIALILALVFFAKSAPKFIMTALGIKSSSGLGVGLGGALAGGAALLGGAGIMGALTAAGTQMDEEANAQAQGKSAGHAWTKGRDLAAQLKTGDKNAKGGAYNNLMSNMRKNAVRSAAGKRAAAMGLSKGNLDNLKGKMLAAKDNLAIAQSELQAAGQKLGTGKDADENGRYQTEYDNAKTKYQAASKKAGTIEADYNKAKSQYDSMGLGTTWAEDHTAISGGKKALYKAGRAVSRPVKSIKEGVSAVKSGASAVKSFDVGGAVQSAGQAVSNAVQHPIETIIKPGAKVVGDAVKEEYNKVKDSVADTIGIEEKDGAWGDNTHRVADRVARNASESNDRAFNPNDNKYN